VVKFTRKEYLHDSCKYSFRVNLGEAIGSGFRLSTESTCLKNTIKYKLYCRCTRSVLKHINPRRMLFSELRGFICSLPVESSWETRWDGAYAYTFARQSFL